MPHRSSDNDYSVLYNDIPEKIEIKADADAVSMWDKIHEIRDDVSKALENARNAKVIGKSLEAKVVLYAKDELYDFIKSVEKELATAFIVSEIEVINGAEGEYKGELENLSVSVLKANGEKCERCWIFSDTVGKNEKHPTLCKRCAEVVD